MFLRLLLFLPLTAAAAAPGFVFRPPLAARFDFRSAPPAPPHCHFVPERPLPDLPAPLPAALTEALAALQKDVDAMVDPKISPSVSAGVAFRGQLIWYHGAGKTKKTWFGAKAPTADTKYRIGSVSKVFPVLQAYMLHDQGKLYLDQTLAELGSVRFLSKFGQRQQPTVRELASQRAGLPRELTSDLCQGLTCPANVTNAQVLASINDTITLIAEPGEITSYSNLAYSLLGHELARLVAADAAAADSTAEGYPEGAWEKWTQANILDPLNMSRTGFGLDLAKETNDVATGYNVDGSAVGTYTLGWNGPAGGMHSSVRDVSTLAGALMADASPLIASHALHNELLQPVSLDTSGGTVIGTPWEMQFHNNSGFLVRRKGGNVPGYAALLSMVPELELSLVMLWPNMNTEELSASVSAMDRLLKPFADMFQAVQDHPKNQPQPDNRDRFLGNWTLKKCIDAGLKPPYPLQCTAPIFLTNDTLSGVLYALDIGAFLRLPSWASRDAEAGGGGTSDDLVTLQLWVPQEILSCVDRELLAQFRQYVEFDFTDTDRPTMRVPGYIGSAWEWVKDASPSKP